MKFITFFTTVLLSASSAALVACASAPAKPTQPLTPYTCNGNPVNLLADYNARGTGTVDIHIADKVYSLKAVSTDNGTRYSNTKSEYPKPGTLVWWTKESAGYLYEVATRADNTLYEKQLTNCTSNPQPLQLNAVPEPAALPGTIPGTIPGTLFAPRPATPTGTV